VRHIVPHFLKFQILCGRLLFLAVLFFANGSHGATLSGDPSLDEGWVFHGNSLENGYYVRGAGNYAFDGYTTRFTVTDSSLFNLSGQDDPAFLPYYETTAWIKADAREWAAGDVVIGIGGVFQKVTAEEAGWDALSGTGANQAINGEYRFKLQAKIGAADSTWSISTIAPGAGNGSGSTASGGSAAFLVRTGGWYPLSVWENFEQTLLGVQQKSHLDHPDIGLDAARIIWTWDAENHRVGSWELLLNVSLIEADLRAAGFTGAIPGQLGDDVISSVQIASGAYTDALFFVAAPPPIVDPVEPIPEPSILALALLAGTGLVIWRRLPC